MADRFVGREKELAKLEGALFPTQGAPRSVSICALQAMRGVGKKHLVDRLHERHRDRFPGGYWRIPCALPDPATAAALLRRVADTIGVAPDAAAISARLREPRSLLHLLDCDAPHLGPAVAEAVAALSGAGVVVTGRHPWADAVPEVVRIQLGTLSPAQSVELLSRAFRAPAGEEERRQLTALARELGYLPRAIDLAAKCLSAGATVPAYLAALRQRAVDLKPRSLTGTVSPEENSRRILAAATELLRDTPAT